MSDKPASTLLIVAGPNGSGKSTITARLAARLHFPVIDPDAIARDIRPDAPEQVAIEAGREAILRQQSFLVQELSFAVETTLAGNVTLRLMEQARRRGYFVDLIFVGLDSAELNIQRVALRVARCGHHVPSEDVRRRYERSMRNLNLAIERADHVVIYDNTSDEGPREVLAFTGGSITARASELPAWIERALHTHLYPREG